MNTRKAADRIVAVMTEINAEEIEVKSTAKVKLRIANMYEDGSEIETQVETTVPLPVPAEGTEEREDWEYDHIYECTGTGKTDGDSWYDVDIIESDEPSLLGMTFEFGY